jgi:putative CocE/NonD family hydrolase
MSRTPYDASGSAKRTKSQFLTELLPVMDTEFVNDGYIRVYQDIRGMHKSEGEFVMTRPICGPLNTTGIDESTDTYDTIDWLIKNTPECNGKVGVVGSSYLGFTTLMAEIKPHPALKAVVPQSPMVDTWMGDDDFHNGAFRQGSFDYAVGQGNDKGNGGGPAYGVGDDYEMYLKEGSAGDHARRWGLDKAPFNQLILQNPAYTAVWSDVAVDKWMAAQPLVVPTMLVVGQWDQEDSYGSPACYRAMKPKDKNNNMVTLVIGPWRHSGVNHYGYSLGDLTFTGDTAKEFRVKYMKPFFDHYLKDGPDPHTPPVLTYGTGINRWEESPKWPMGTPTPLYLGEQSSAAFESPKPNGHDDYVSDPAKPVPFVPRPVTAANRSQWTTWLVQDQRFVDGRPDVLSYETTPLNKPIHIMGAPQADLFAATSGTDSDWVVKLIDVYPNTSPEGDPGQVDKTTAGEQIPIGIEIFRGRYVHGFATPGPLSPGKVEEYKWDLPNVDHVFLSGHKIMIQVQSTLFPLYDRNPQTYVENIFNAKAGDYKAATQSIWRGGSTASAVLLPIVDAH